MLYPKITVDKEEVKMIERFGYFKDDLISVFKIFGSYRSFILFLQKKFHF